MEPSERDRLIDKVQRGEMTPVEAEAEAARQAVGPLARTPDPNQFDPMKETWWSLPMAVAWIAWRSPDAVREHWDAYRRERWMWQACRWTRGPGTPEYEGFDLVRLPPSNEVFLLLAAAHNPQGPSAREDTPISIGEAKAALWKALAEDLIQATATDLDKRRRVKIPAEAWSDLNWYDEREGNVLHPGGLASGGFGEIRFRSRAVITLWGAKPPAVEQLPDAMAPTGPGYMPLFCAVQWIATRGNSISVGLSDTIVWDDAYAKMLSHLASEEIATTGVHHGQRRKIEGLIFADIAVDHQFESERSDLWGSTELYLCSFPYVDNEHWRRGFDDSLRNRFDRKWSRLMVLKSDVLRLWPFDLNEQHSGGRTGAPGRPTSMPEIELEFQARWRRGEVEQSINKEARTLHDWFVNKHPGRSAPTAKTIANRLRSAHRRRRGEARK